MAAGPAQDLEHQDVEHQDVARRPDRRGPRRRGYRRSGHYAVKLAEDELAAMRVLRESLVADLGGAENISTARMVLIDLAVAAAARCLRVSEYIASLPSLVDRRNRHEWKIVRDARSGERHLQALLRDVGLERAAKPVEELHDYLDRRASERDRE